MRQMKGLKIKLALAIFFIVISLDCQGFCFLVRNKEAEGEKVFYQVRFNGVKVGKIEFEYQGRQKIGGKLQDVVVVISDVKILGLFEIEGKEKIYVDTDTHLVLRVEREVEFLGKQESIIEEYNQKEGWVKITQKKDKITQSRLIRQNPPIHNVIVLYFLYPLDLQDKTIGKTFEFNLPLRKISIKLRGLRKITTDEGAKEVYLLEGLPQRFKIWLEREKRLPLRLEMRTFLGKVVMLKI